MALKTGLAAAGLIGFFLVQPAEAGSLEAQKLKALFPGSFQAVVNGWAVHFTARGDGSLIGKFRSKTDTGRWSIKSGQLCIMLTQWLGGRTACSQVVQDGQWYRADNVMFRKL
jgi:hypothetical protein